MLKLIVSNVGTLQDGEYELTPGLVCITGNNGTGKSTLVNALYLAFTGECIDSTPLIDVVKWGEDVAEIELVTKDFSIVRKIGKVSSHTLKKDGQILLTKKQEISEYLKHYYGVTSLPVALSVYFSAQGSLPLLVDAPPAKRIELLLQVCNLSHYEKIRSAAYELLIKLPELSYDADMLESTSQRLQEYEKTLALKKAELKTLEDSYAAMTPLSMEEWSKYHTAVSEEVHADISAKYITTGLAVHALQTQERELQTHIDKLKASWDLQEARVELQSLSQQRELLLQSADSSGESLQSLQNRLEGLENAERAVYRATCKIKDSMDALRKESELLKEGVCPLSKGIPCDTLMSRYSPEILEQRGKELQQQLTAAESDMSEVGELKSTVRAQIESRVLYDTSLDKLNALIVSITQRHPGLQEEGEVVAEGSLSIEGAEVTLNDFLTSMDDVKKRLEAAYREMLSLKAQLESHTFCCTDEDKASFMSRWDAQQQRKSRLTDLKADIAPLQRMYVDTKELLESLQSTATASEQRKKPRAILSLLRDVCHREALPLNLLQSALSGLNNKLEEYGNLFNFKYTVSITAEGVFEYKDSLHTADTRRLSGGQKYIAALLLKLAFTDLVGGSFPVFLIDEPTTGMDDVNIGYLSEVLKLVAEQKQSEGVCVVAPTHSTSLSEVSDIIIDLNQQKVG